VLVCEFHNGLPFSTFMRRLGLHDGMSVTIAPLKRARGDIGMALDNLTNIIYAMDCKTLSVIF
jgi:hypothetical protein